MSACVFFPARKRILYVAFNLLPDIHKILILHEELHSPSNLVCPCLFTAPGSEALQPIRKTIQAIGASCHIFENFLQPRIMILPLFTRGPGSSGWLSCQAFDLLENSA